MFVLSDLLMGLSLSVDSFAVAVTAGISVKNPPKNGAFKMAFWFALFQGLFPVVGFFIGASVRKYMGEWGNFLAFALLAALGLKMILGEFKHETVKTPANMFKTRTLIALALATSIDALTVGISLAMTKSDIWGAALIIGAVTFGMTYLGAHIGKHLGRTFEKEAGIIGGIVLIALGVNALF